MNPYFNSINGFGGGFIAFWPSGAVVAAILRPAHNLVYAMNQMLNK